MYVLPCYHSESEFKERKLASEPMETHGDESPTPEKEGMPPMWRAQLIATVKKNIKLRKSRVALLIYLIPFGILTAVLLVLSVLGRMDDFNYWDPENEIMGGLVFFYYVMSLASLILLGIEKESGFRDFMLQVSGCVNNGGMMRAYFILL